LLRPLAEGRAEGRRVQAAEDLLRQLVQEGRRRSYRLARLRGEQPCHQVDCPASRGRGRGRQDPDRSPADRRRYRHRGPGHLRRGHGVRPGRGPRGLEAGGLSGSRVLHYLRRTHAERNLGRIPRPCGKAQRIGPPAPPASPFPCRRTGSPGGVGTQMSTPPTARAPGMSVEVLPGVVLTALPVSWKRCQHDRTLRQTFSGTARGVFGGCQVKRSSGWSTVTALGTHFFSVSTSVQEWIFRRTSAETVNPRVFSTAITLSTRLSRPSSRPSSRPMPTYLRAKSLCHS